MAVFFDTGGGDTYAGVTKEQALAAMKQDVGEKEFQLFIDEDSIREVSGDTKMRMEKEDGSGGELSTLDEQFTDMGHGYCIASENC